MAQSNKKQEAAERNAETEQANLEAANKTTELIDKAAKEKADKEDAAQRKRAADDARANEETQRVADETRAKEQERQRAAEAAEAEAQKDRVVVVVPKAFRLNLDNHKVIEYTVGTYPMPRKHLEHWYTKASGVKLATAALDETVAAKTFKSGPVTEKQKALVAAVNAIDTDKYETADDAIAFIKSQYGADVTPEIEALINGKFYGN